ncbi:complex I NDUFA9 subunit family protein [Phenylobacterium sp.]|uniref:complex I NDUFA9 subunit family protein n=1 Tax=Phenylobacterium sp. TaxID=1871053 RepID=UPI0025F8CA5C|nr:complex I NDUFA9 subunit family protein [Phenylobacterium sp.]MCA3741630.1 complex I NDUFA9 subunit family protein [Phenylobacterium sp.]
MPDLVTVFGGSGFIGTQIVRALARRGARIRVAVRQPHLAHAMRLMGDVGQVEVVQANIRDAGSVIRAVQGADAVINLVGLLYETGRQTFQAVHVDAARNIAQAAADAGARLVQMSALGADPASASRYARSKAEGEAVVRKILPSAVILRPSIVFGPGDDFFNKFGEMAVVSPFLPLIGWGRTRFQPVYVGDVARAAATVALDPQHAGRTFELCGPGIFTFREILDLIQKETGRRRLYAPLPFGAAGLIGTLCAPLALTPVAPPLTADQVELLKTDNVLSGEAPGLADLGIAPETVEAILPTYLYRFRKGGQFAGAAGNAVA